MEDRTCSQAKGIGHLEGGPIERTLEIVGPLETPVGAIFHPFHALLEEGSTAALDACLMALAGRSALPFSFPSGVVIVIVLPTDRQAVMLDPRSHCMAWPSRTSPRLEMAGVPAL